MKKSWALLLVLGLVFAWISGGHAELRVENIQFRAAHWGPVRENTTFSQGEWIIISLDITGIGMDPVGMQDVELYLTATHDSGRILMPRKRMFAIQQKPLYSQNRVAAVLRLLPGADWPEGSYVISLEAGDRSTNSISRAEMAFVKTGLIPALINLGLSADKDGEISLPWVVQKGMKAFIVLTISGLTYSEGNQTDFTLDVVVRQEGKEPVGQARVLAFNSAFKEKMELIPAHVSLPFNLSGVFSYELLLTDRLASRQIKAILPITVLD